VRYPGIGKGAYDDMRRYRRAHELDLPLNP
jgi:hypothetical protein